MCNYINIQIHKELYAHLRLMRRRHALAVQLSPVEISIGKHRMIHYFEHSSAAVAQAIRRIVSQQPSDEIRRI